MTYKHRPPLRSKVREVLSMLKEGRRVTDEILLSSVNQLIDRDVVSQLKAASLEELRSVLGWLIDRKQVGTLLNQDTDKAEYFITMSGRQAMLD